MSLLVTICGAGPWTMRSTLGLKRHSPRAKHGSSSCSSTTWLAAWTKAPAAATAPPPSTGTWMEPSSAVRATCVLWWSQTRFGASPSPPTCREADGPRGETGSPLGPVSTLASLRYYVYRCREGELHQLCFDGSWSYRHLGAAIPK